MTTDQLPSALEAEKQVLGSILLLPEVLPTVRAIVGPLDFLDTAHRALFSEIDLAAECGEPIVDAVLCERLKAYPEFCDGKAGRFLLEIAASTATAAYVEHFANAVHEASGKRRAAQLFELAGDDALNGQPLENTLTKAAECIDELRREFATTKPRTKFSLAELCKEFPSLRPAVIHGIARQGETVNVISNSKAGKTCLVHGLIICEITREPWLGRFNTSGGRVLLLDNELHPDLLAYRIRTVGDAMGIPAGEYEHGLEIWPMRGKGRDINDLAAELAGIQRGEFSLIVWDSKYRFAPKGKSENDNQDEREIYDIADRIANHTGAANIFTHHGSKGDQSGKRVTDVGAGAGAQSRATDTHLILREHEQSDVMVLETACRSFAPVEPLALQWAFPLWRPIDGIDTAKLKGRLPQGEQRQVDRDREGVNAIIKALGSGPATARALRQRSGLGKDKQQRLLDLLASQGHVTVKEISVRGNQCHEYALSQDDK